MLRHHNKFLLITLLLIFLSSAFQTAAYPPVTSSDPKNPPAVYRRYAHRAPPIYADDEYVDYIIEDFYVRSLPPKFASSDDDIELIIKCDVNPEYKDCPKLKTKNENPMQVKPTTAKPHTEQPPPEDIPILPHIPTDTDYEAVDPTTDIPWSSEIAASTEADPILPEGSGDEIDDLEDSKYD